MNFEVGNLDESEIVCRRSRADDALHINLIIGEAFYIYNKRYGGSFNLRYIIETSYLSITAETRAGKILGFAAFSDAPVLEDPVWKTWPEYTANCYAPDSRFCISGSLWLSFFASITTCQDAVINSIFRTLYVTLPDVDNVLFALPEDTPEFSPVMDYFYPLQKTAEFDTRQSKGEPVFNGSLHWTPRGDVTPNLTIRRGKVEDYDDLMPLLLQGTGVLTAMGNDFFLDELLEKQDGEHAALVAESDTGAIVGLVCLRSVPKDQQDIVKLFDFKHYHKLKRIWPESGMHNTKNTSFQVTFFYLNPEYDSRAIDFLEPAFNLFPHAEFGFIRLPHNVTDHPLLASFQYVPQRDRLTLRLGCFVVCKYALQRHECASRRTRVEDMSGVSSMLMMQSELPRSEIDRIVISVQNTNGLDVSFVLTHREHVVGVAVLRLLSAAEVFNLTANFDVDSKGDLHAMDSSVDDLYRQTTLDTTSNGTSNTHIAGVAPPGALVKHFYVTAVFRSWIRLFAREMMRQMGLQLLFYTAGLDDEVFEPLVAELTLALPRRVLDLPEMVSGGVSATDELLTLHFASRKLLSEMKTRVHSRIVVIGSSSTGLSFLFTLLSLPYLHFSNLVLISRDGIPDHPDEAENQWFANTMDFLPREYVLFRLPGKVRVVEGTMVDFERYEKYVVTDNQHVEPYDYLILAAGRQYTLPQELSNARSSARNGVFVLSSKDMMNRMRQHVHESEMYEDSNMNVVVYGSALDAYCLLTTLLELGVRESRIVLVSPESANQSPFNDPTIQRKVDRLCDTLGIRCFKHHELERMEYNDDNNLTGVYLHNRGPGYRAAGKDGDDDVGAGGGVQQQARLVELPCWMFAYCHEKDIDPAILSALNKRSIVFDGRVIVENNYRTTDPQVYAAGPIAMFSRRFGPSEGFETYRSTEVGRHLAYVVLGHLGVEEFKQYAEDDSDAMGIDHEQLRRERQGQLFAVAGANDSAADAKDEAPMARPRPLPTYSDNLSWALTLPGGYHYFHSRTRACTGESLAQGSHLSTETPQGDNYMHLAINRNQQIQTVSYLSSKEGEIHNWKILVGMPQTYLNLVQRWNDKLIADLVSFLRQQWARAVFFDKFTTFQQSLRVKLRKQKDVQMLAHTIMDFVNTEHLDHIDERQRRQYGAELSADTRHMMELELIKFLHQNKQFLPDFFLPDITAFVS